MRRFRLDRSAAVYWTTALALALVTGVFVAGIVRGAEERASRYGDVRTVLVAARNVSLGTRLRAGDLARRDMPASFVPGAPVATDAVGRTVIVPMVRGEVVLASKLAPSGLGGVAALLRPGERALALPVGPGTPPLVVGDHVDVLATPQDAPSSVVVARGARVVGTDDRAVTVAVHPEEAPTVAAALAAGTVTVVLAGA